MYEKFKYPIPYDPFCIQAEAAFYGSILGDRNPATSQVMIDSVLEVVLPKRLIGLPTSLVLTGKHAGHLITTNLDGTLSRLNRPLLMAPSKRATTTVAMGRKIEKCITYSPILFLQIYFSYLNYFPKLTRALDSRSVYYDRDTMQQNMENYTLWLYSQTKLT